jgi:threonine/homoserine/homoserine lactone efflux protein
VGDIGHFIAFLGVSALVIVTPGPDTALTIRNTLLGGRRSGIQTAFGVVADQATWALATAAGVAALLRASQPAFDAVRLVGAAYLIYLGAQALVAAVRGRESRLSAPGAPKHGAPFRQGLISNLTNPKMAAFFSSLLPQFAGGHASFLELLTLGLIFCSMTLVWLTGYAVAVAKAGDFLRRAKVKRALEGIIGAALVALGLRLATERV